MSFEAAQTQEHSLGNGLEAPPGAAILDESDSNEAPVGESEPIAFCVHSSAEAWFVWRAVPCAAGEFGALAVFSRTACL